MHNAITQRLVLLFDGTWNDPQDRTNVYRLARHLHDADTHGVPQPFFYDPGVGTHACDRLLGGVSGYGLSRNLLQGYDWLSRHYREGSEIWVFGFSRGAFTARSLVGLLRKCGLLQISTPHLQQQAEALYRNRSLHPDDLECKAFRCCYSREVRVRFVGVWDTVGALGIPGTKWSEKSRFAWHDTELSGIVDYAYHAMALDEQREEYDVIAWTSPDGQPKESHLGVEQRWFMGAHADIGGGYPDYPPADIPFAWLMGKAAAAGLALKPIAEDATSWRAPLHDSYAEFMGGLYAKAHQLVGRGDGRFVRGFSHDKRGRLQINITIDPSVQQRWRELDYRPATLVQAGFEQDDDPRFSHRVLSRTQPAQEPR